MTDKQIRDAAVVELKKTTQGYLKSSGDPRPLVGAQWKKGLELLAQIGLAPPPPPPPSGPVREVFPGQALSVIGQAVVGDTVLLRGGLHPKLTLNKSFAGGQVVVRCEPGTYLEGVDTNSQDGYIFDTIESRRAVNFSDINDSCFYIKGTSDRITLIRSKLIGSCHALKQYCAAPGWATDLKVIDCDISAAGEDLTHWDGAKGLLIDHNYIHHPTSSPGSHQDGIQIQRGEDFIISRNHFKWDTIPQAEGPSQAMIIGSSAPILVRNGVIVNNLVGHWHGGRGLILLMCDNMKIVNNTMQSTGPSTSVNLNGWFGAITNVEIWNNILENISNQSATPTFGDSNWITGGGGNYTGTNSQSGAPGFVDTVSYELTGGSAARGLGNGRAGTPTIDLDGNPRTTPVLGCRI